MASATQARPVTQAGLVRSVAYRVSLKAGPRVEVGRILDEVLAINHAEYGGEIFAGKTPRASARRALYEAAELDTLIIRDGKGFLRFRLDALTDAVIQGDAWSVMRLIPDGSIGCIVADFPNTSLDNHRNIGKATRITNGQYFQTKDCDLDILQEFYRVLAPGAYAFVYMPPLQSESIHIWFQVLTAVLQTAFVPIRGPTWKKHRGMGYRFTSQTEPLLVLGKKFKGGRLPDCHDRTITDLLDVKPVRGRQRTPYMDYTEEDEAKWKAAAQQYGGRGEIPREVRKALPGKYHETEKPPELARRLLRVAHRRGELLLDCFAGAGHAAVVAHELGMTYLCIEANPRTVDHLLIPRLNRLGLAPKTLIELTP